MNGILVVHKPKDFTSRDVVNKVSHLLHTKKVGHTGTLDPIATGVLILCVGESTSLVEIITEETKEYTAEVLLGIETDTIDYTGVTLKEENTIFTKQQIEEVLNSMKGTYSQEVPIYSAVKIKGRKLYEYARNHEEVELPKRDVTIHEITLLGEVKQEENHTIFTFNCTVSKGTYIRSLIRDIALKLNTVGIMTNLCRTKQGTFLLEDSYTLEQIENGEYELLPMASCLKQFYLVTVDDVVETKIKNGQILDNKYVENPILFQNEKQELLALYKIYEKDNTKIKPWKMLYMKN